MGSLSLVILLLISAGAWGSDKDGYIAIVSGRSCKEFVELREVLKRPNADVTDTASVMEYSHTLGWIAGYLTAVNWQMPNTYQILGMGDFESAVSWIENYCRDNPSHDISRGMRALTMELYPRRYKTRKEAGTPSDKERQ